MFAGMGSAETLATPRISCEVKQDAGVTVLTAKGKGCEEPVMFRIDWTHRDEKPGIFKATRAADGAITSTYRLGKTTVTRTIIADAAADCILIHVIADQPGAISFRARYDTKHPTKIANRREILFTGGKIQAHAWVIPFESDVRDDGKGTVFLDGEGEALIILNLTADPETSPISETHARLGEKHDPGHTPPSPHMIWEGIQEERVRGRMGEREKQ